MKDSKDLWPTTAQVDSAIQSASGLANQLHALDSGIPPAEHDPMVRDLRLLKEFLGLHARESGSRERTIPLRSIEQSVNVLLKAVDWPDSHVLRLPNL